MRQSLFLRNLDKINAIAFGWTFALLPADNAYQKKELQNSTASQS